MSNVQSCFCVYGVMIVCRISEIVDNCDYLATVVTRIEFNNYSSVVKIIM